MTEKRAKDDWDLLDDIIECAGFVVLYSKGGKANFLASPMAQDAVIRRFEVMGEAANRMTKDFQQAHATIPWRSITAFRNRLIHGYDEIEMDRVWEAVAGTLKDALPVLKRLRDG